jgi:hypothetical protein
MLHVQHITFFRIVLKCVIKPYDQPLHMSLELLLFPLQSASHSVHSSVGSDYLHY